MAASKFSQLPDGTPFGQSLSALVSFAEGGPMTSFGRDGAAAAAPLLAAEVEAEAEAEAEAVAEAEAATSSQRSSQPATPPLRGNQKQTAKKQQIDIATAMAAKRPRKR